MGAQALEFAGSFAAVALLVLAVHLAGFSRQARLHSEDEARELARLAPGGFDVAQIALDRDGGAALALSSDGRLLLLRPHGAQFVAVPVSPAAVRREGEVLRVEPAGAPAIALRLGPDAAGWIAG